MVALWWGPSSGFITTPFSACPHMAEGARDPCGSSSVRALIPFRKVPRSQPKRLPKAPPPYTITFGVNFNVWILGGHKHSNHRSLPPFDFVSWFSDLISVTHPLFSENSSGRWGLRAGKRTSEWGVYVEGGRLQPSPHPEPESSPTPTAGVLQVQRDTRAAAGRHTAPICRDSRPSTPEWPKGTTKSFFHPSSFFSPAPLLSVIPMPVLP